MLPMNQVLKINYNKNIFYDQPLNIISARVICWSILNNIMLFKSPDVVASTIPTTIELERTGSLTGSTIHTTTEGERTGLSLTGEEVPAEINLEVTTGQDGNIY